MKGGDRPIVAELRASGRRFGNPLALGLRILTGSYETTLDVTIDQAEQASSGLAHGSGGALEVRSSPTVFQVAALAPFARNSGWIVFSASRSGGPGRVAADGVLRLNYVVCLVFPLVGLGLLINALISGASASAWLFGGLWSVGAVGISLACTWTLGSSAALLLGTLERANDGPISIMWRP